MVHQPLDRQIETIVHHLDNLRAMSAMAPDSTIDVAADLLREIGQDEMANNLVNLYRTRHYRRIGGLGKQSQLLIRSAALQLSLKFDPDNPEAVCP